MIRTSHFHPRFAVDLGTSNAHKQSKSKVYVEHLSIEGPTANPMIIHAPFMQLIRNTMQYHAISIRTKTLQQNALEFYSDIELFLKQQHSKVKTQTKQAWDFIDCCMVPLGDGCAFARSNPNMAPWYSSIKMSTRILTSSDRNIRMQPVFSMLTNVKKCEQATPPKAPETAPAACSIAFVTWHPSTASTASSQLLKQSSTINQSAFFEKSAKYCQWTRMASYQVISNAATILSSRRSLGPCWLLRCTTWRWYRLVQHGGLLGKFSWKNDKQSRYDSNMISMNITFKPGLVNYHSTGLTDWCKRNSYSDWLRGHKCHGLNRSFRSV